MVNTATSASRENRLLKWRAALGSFMQGSTTRPRVLFCGDSKMMGAGAGPSSSNTYTGGAYAKRRSAIVASYLTRLGLPGVDAALYGNNRAPIPSEYNPNLVLGPGWSWSAANAVAAFGNTPVAQNSGGGAGNFAVTLNGTFDTIDIIYGQGGLAGTFTVSDGASLIDTIDAFNASGKPVRKTISLASRASGKTINFARSSGTAFIFAVIPYDSQTPSIELVNAGAYGSRTSDWMGSGSNFDASAASAWEALAPHLTFIALGANDKNQSVSVETFQSNIQTLITRAQLTSSVVLVNESYGTAGFFTNSAAYRQALIDLAETNGCIFHDEAARVNYQENPTWFSDNIHEKDFAHADEARMYLPHILPHLKF